MNPTISVVVGTYGDEAWAELAEHRAIPSVMAQTYHPVDITYSHEATLHEARNAGARSATGEWLCFLDADDELDKHYLHFMAAVIARLEGDWLVQPATLGVVDGHDDPYPVVIPAKALIDGNFMVIGTLIRRSQFERLGGFRDWPYAEDWDLWLRSWIDGARLVACADAIYRVHVNPHGRNNGDRALQVRTYNQIRTSHLDAATRRRVNS